MQTFKSTLYGPQLPSAGVVLDACFIDDRLVAQLHEVNIEVARITSSIGGFEHDQLFLHWQDAACDHWTLTPSSQGDMAIIRATAPPALRLHMEKWRGDRRQTRIIWGTIGSIAGACLLVAGLAWWKYDRLLTLATDQVSIAREEQLGKSILEHMKNEKNIIDKGLAVSALQDIGSQLTKGSRYKYQWFVKKDDTINAFALPGAIIVVHSALLEKAGSADELAAVLAHEVQHVEQRHTLKNMINSLAWAAVLLVTLGDVDAASAVIVHHVGQMYFSRDSEEEADRLGFQSLVRARIKPDGMVTFFQKLEHAPGADIPQWISSHPATSERIQSIQKMIKEQHCNDCRPLKLDWKKIQEDLT